MVRMRYLREKSILNKNLKRVNYLMEFSLLLPLLRSCLQLVSCGNYQGVHSLPHIALFHCNCMGSL